MPGRITKYGPVALTTTMTTNIMQGGNGSALIYDVVKRVHVVNKTNAAQTYSLWLGATTANAAGTEVISAHSVPANSEHIWYPETKMLSTDFLVGGASAATSLTIIVETEQFVV